MGLVVAVGVAVVASALARASRARGRRADQGELLRALGLQKLGGSAWHEGQRAGRRLAAKASLVGGAGQMGVADGTRITVRVIVLVAVEHPPVGGRVSRAGRASGDGFEHRFVAAGGASNERVSEPAKHALMAWIAASDDHIELVDRDHRLAYAGPALVGVQTVLRVEHSGVLNQQALTEWLDDALVRANSLEASQGSLP